MNATAYRLSRYSLHLLLLPCLDLNTSKCPFIANLVLVVNEFYMIGEKIGCVFFSAQKKKKYTFSKV